MDEPSGDVRLREHTLESERVWIGRFLDVRRDRVRLPDGGESTREYIVHPGAVVVVPLLDDGRLVMVRQWRHPMARVMLEFPAGKLDGDEPPLACGIRELAEETGYHAAQWARAGVIHNAIAYSDEGIEVWFARGLAAGAPMPVPGEFVAPEIVEPVALDAMVRTGEVTDAKTIAALLWLQNWHAGRWPLVWGEAPRS